MNTTQEPQTPYRFPKIEIGDTVRFKQVAIQKPFPRLFQVFGISHYLAIFHSNKKVYKPFCLGFYPILSSPQELILTAFQPKKGRLLSPDPFHIGDEPYLTGCQGRNNIIEYSLNGQQASTINGLLSQGRIHKKNRAMIELPVEYSILPIRASSYNCRTWLFQLFPRLHTDAWCHSNYYYFINTLRNQFKFYENQ